MTERLSALEARIGTVQQLSAVITAMRAIAAARTHEARSHLEGIRTYAATISGAIGRALTFLTDPRHSPAAPEMMGGHAVIALCAEQGFAGAFSERVLDRGRRASAMNGERPSELFLIGDRGMMIAREREISVAWSAPMIVHAGQMAALASRIVDALYERIDAGRVARVTVIHAAPDSSAALQIAERSLFPFDFARFPSPPSPNAVAPVLTLPPDALLDQLVEEYVFAEICEAVMLSFAAENEARMRAMIAARANVARTLDSLIARSRQLRQEEITSEIIELATGSAARSGH